MRQLSIYEQADNLWNMQEEERQHNLSTMTKRLRKTMVAFIETRKARIREQKKD